MSISTQTIQQIQDTAQILDVVQDFVSLRKKGQNFWACCPFHNERTPSFSVNPSKGIYKCFGCGKGGDSISFVMEIENLSYPEALRYLAQKFNIEIEEDTRPTDTQLAEQNEREQILIILEIASKYYQHQLTQNEGQAIGLSYFKERGFIQKTIETFGLGYSLSSWDAFTQYAIQKGYTYDLLQKAGLSILTEKGTWIDRFRERVIFPIHNVSGKPIAFGARTLKKDKKEAKYLNSPETSVYQKRKIVYGIAQAKKSIRELDNCYLVEGYTDVISLHQAGITNVVASSGTSLTQDQIRLIRRFTENITILYDGDFAGIKASLRGIDLILEEGLNVKVVAFPQGEDPDSCIRRIGYSAFQAFLQENVRDFITFKSTLFLNEIKDNPSKQAEILKDILLSISKIFDEVKRRIYLQECSKIFRIDEQTLYLELDRILKKNKNSTEGKDDTNILSQNNNSNLLLGNTAQPDIVEDESWILNVLYPNENQFIKFLLFVSDRKLENTTTLLSYYMIEETKDLEFTNPLYSKILNECRKVLLKNKNKILDYNFLYSLNDASIISKLNEFLYIPYEISKNWEVKYKIIIKSEIDNLQISIDENILRLKFWNVLKLCKQNELDLKEAKNSEEQDFYIKTGLVLQKMRISIAEKLKNVLLKLP